MTRKSTRKREKKTRNYTKQEKQRKKKHDLERQDKTKTNI